MNRFMSRICYVLIAHIMYLFYFYSFSYNLFINWGQTGDRTGDRTGGQDLWQSLWQTCDVIFWRDHTQQFLYFVFCYHLTSSSSFLQGIAKTSFSSALASCVISTYFSWLNSSCLTNSCTGTSSAFAIAISASRLGWVVLVTHLEIVAWSFPSLSANHLLFRSCSARP